MDGALSISVVKEILSCTLLRNYQTCSHSGKHDSFCARNKEEGTWGRAGGSVCSIRLQRHEHELVLWRHPSFTHYTIFELIKFAMFFPLCSFQDVFILTSSLMSLDGEET